MSDYSSENIREIYERHFVTVYRVCFMYLRNVHDTEDAVHNTFLKLIEKQKSFESTEHEKAWLIRVSHTRIAECMQEYAEGKQQEARFAGRGHCGE